MLESIHEITGNEKRRQDSAIFNLIEVIQKYRSKALYNIKVIAADNPIETLVETSMNFDLLIVGTPKSGLLKRATVGTCSTQIAERSRKFNLKRPHHVV